MIGINYLGKRYERLANQMFQYAAVKGIAKNRGFQYCIPPSGYRDQNDEWTEHQLFNTFHLKNLSSVQVQFIDMEQHPYTKTESHYHFDEDLFNNCPDWLSLVGFFQSEKYFLNVRDELLEDFTFKDGLDGIAQDAIKNIENPIALHIRRTDYAKYGHHPIQPISYYQKEIDKEKLKIQKVVFMMHLIVEKWKNKKIGNYRAAKELAAFFVSKND